MYFCSFLILWFAVIENPKCCFFQISHYFIRAISKKYFVREMLCYDRSKSQEKNCWRDIFLADTQWHKKHKPTGCSQSVVFKHVHVKFSGRKKCGVKKCASNIDFRSVSPLWHSLVIWRLLVQFQLSFITCYKWTLLICVSVYKCKCMPHVS